MEINWCGIKWFSFGAAMAEFSHSDNFWGIAFVVCLAVASAMDREAEAGEGKAGE